jgi:transcription initiation factor TFIIIB Brf1 subunit/transcription initiation factor TFIIB
MVFGLVYLNTMDQDFFNLPLDVGHEIRNETKDNTSLEDSLLDQYFSTEKYEKVGAGTTKFLSCQVCGGTEDDLLLEDMLTCTKCGTVLSRPIDVSPEYRFFGHEDRSSGDPCRIGAPLDPRLPQSSLCTIILPSHNRAMNRIIQYQKWNNLPYKERALLGAFDRLHLAANNHGLSTSVIDDAKELYVKLNGLCDRRGLSRDSLLASCVYTALKRAGSPRRPQEIGDIFSLKHETFTKAFKFFQEVLAQAMQKGLITEDWNPSNLTSTRAADYVELPLSKLPITRSEYQSMVADALHYAQIAEGSAISPENTPPSLAAGIVGFVCEKWKPGEIPFEKIASVCNVSQATLQKCLRRLQQVLT